MSNAFVGTVCLDNVSDSDDLPNMNQVGPDHIRAIPGNSRTPRPQLGQTKLLCAYFSCDLQMFDIKSFRKALVIKICNHLKKKLRGTPSKIGLFGNFCIKKDFCQKALFFRGIPLIFFKWLRIFITNAFPNDLISNICIS